MLTRQVFAHPESTVLSHALTVHGVLARYALNERATTSVDSSPHQYSTRALQRCPVLERVAGATTLAAHTRPRLKTTNKHGTTSLISLDDTPSVVIILGRMSRL
jgi:hypothetical protein